MAIPPQVLQDVPKDDVGNEVEILMGTEPPPTKAVVEQQANGKYKITATFPDTGG